MSIKYMVLDIVHTGIHGEPECDIIAYDISDIQEAERQRVSYLEDALVPVEEYNNILVVMYKE